MFHWNEAGISLKLVLVVMSTDFSLFLLTYRDCFVIFKAFWLTVRFGGKTVRPWVGIPNHESHGQTARVGSVLSKDCKAFMLKLTRAVNMTPRICSNIKNNALLTWPDFLLPWVFYLTIVRSTDLPILTVLPWVSRFFVIFSHGLTTRLPISWVLGKNHFEMK